MTTPRTTLSVSLDVSSIATTTAGMQQRTMDLRPAWERIHNFFIQEEIKQFRTQGIHLAGGWAPLNPAYAKRKKPKPPAPFGILYRYGDLFRSLANATDSYHVFRSKRDVAEMGTSRTRSGTPYPAYHQSGTKTPDRPFIHATDQFVQFVSETIREYVTVGLPHRSRVR